MSGPIRLHLTSGGSAITGAGPDGAIECLGFDSSVTTARESRQGLASGRRMYSPVLVRKRIDRTSPLLLEALTGNHVLEARFDFLQPDAPAVAGSVYYTIELTAARIVSARTLVIEPPPGGRPLASAPVEEIGFDFHRITWTYLDGAITHADDARP